MQCRVCQQKNRSIALFCKYCGEEISPAGAGPDALPPDDFDSLVGLQLVKQAMQREIKAFTNMRSAGFSYDLRNLHSILIGDTGTGKNEIVKVLAKAFYKAGITAHTDVRTVSATDFYEFAKDLPGNIEAAKGRILFIDNVHQLVPAGYQPGQSTPMDKLYTELDKHHGNPIVILASKAVGFREYLLANPEVNNRFNFKFYLPEMTVDQMFDLATKYFQEKSLQPDPDFSVKLKKRLMSLFRKQKNEDEGLKSGKNGFLVRREVNTIVSEHFVKNSSPGALSVLVAEDIAGEVYESKSSEEVLKELDDFIGLDGVKDYIRKMVDLMGIQQADARQTGTMQTIGSHMVLTGNPGTGKTTLARKLGEIFAAAEVISSGHVIEVDRSKLVGQYIGETPLLVQKYCDEAAGGILFIDEAYTLKQDDQDKFGQEAIDTLLKRLEDDRGKFIMIAAGYQNEMQRFINANPGMKSRVKDNFFHLPDYTPSQLLSILQIFVRQGGMVLDAAAEKKAGVLMEEMYQQRGRDFGNGRDVRNLYETIKTNRAARLVASKSYDNLLLAVDLPGDETDSWSTRLDDVLAELNSITGLANVKEEINRLISFLEAEKIRADAGGKKTAFSLHFIFTGNPGTGKTTVARSLAKIFKELKILTKGQLIEVTDKDLVEGYVGQTSIKTNKKIDEALGGVLFIDEAYTLVSPNNSFGQEAINTLLKRMEDDRGKFIVIAAGYEKDMQNFIDSNSGLDSRFTHKIKFADYDPAELYQIFASLADEDRMKLDEGAVTAAKRHLSDLYDARDKRFANGRTVRNEYQKIKQQQARRIGKTKKENLPFDPFLIMSEDITPHGGAAVVPDQDALHRLDKLIGLDSVKREIRSLINYLEIEKMRAAAGGKKTQLNLHFIFKGRPGTGKTTVARILAALFREIGLLSRGQLIEVDRKELVGQFVGQTAPQTTQVIDRAMGGVLFVDEAYTLMPVGAVSDFGKEAIDTLLKRMEDDKGKFIVIAAGYSGDMDRFIQSNEGLASRFTKEIYFEDYNGDELLQIFLLLAAEKGMILEASSQQGVLRYFENIYNTRDAKFANGRTVRNIFDRALQRQAGRLNTTKEAGVDIQNDLHVIRGEDIF